MSSSLLSVSETAFFLCLFQEGGVLSSSLSEGFVLVSSVSSLPWTPRLCLDEAFLAVEVFLVELVAALVAGGFFLLGLGLGIVGNMVREYVQIFFVCFGEGTSDHANDRTEHNRCAVPPVHTGFQRCR